MKYLVAYSLYFLSITCLAQSVKVGAWRDHLSYTKANKTCALNNKIYTCTDNALFVFDTDDNSLERLNTLNGLSDIGVSTIDASDNAIIVAYLNGNIDLINASGIINIPDILRANIIGNKQINHINIIDDLAYLSCGFGIVVLDIAEIEIKESYFIGENNSYTNVLGTAMMNDTIYAILDQGLIQASMLTSTLSNYEAWSYNDFGEGGQFNLIHSFGDKLFLNKTSEVPGQDVIYYYDGLNWIEFGSPMANRSFYSDMNYLTICRKQIVEVYNLNLNLVESIESSVFSAFNKNFNYALRTGKDTYWIAGRNNGLFRYTPQYTDVISPSGPYNSSIAQLKNIGNEMWVVHGNKDENWDPSYFKYEASKLVLDQWSTTNYLINDSVWDVVAFNKYGNDMYFASWRNGLGHYNDGELIALYSEDNSSLQSRANINDWTLVGDIAFDGNGHLWCTNSQTEFPLSVKYTDGSWDAFSLGSNVSSDQRLGKLLIDSYNQKWIQLRDNGLIVFDETRSGANAKKISNADSQGSLASDRVFSMAEDLKGEIWVGTDNGVSVFYDPENIFDDAQAEEVLITQDGYTTYLLKGQKINDIEIDGANRKWFATNNSGVILTSENGTEEIYHFTTDNSPLFSNKIIDIEINQQSGEIFIATDKGLIAFRGDATMGKENYSEAIVFPNPVKPGYEGLISIRGLIPDALVKITDISGNLVYETTAYGGQAVWNGRLLSGDKAHSGVYLVFCSDNDGNINHAAKILFIKD